jgi:FkbM family methyltransferase
MRHTIKKTLFTIQSRHTFLKGAKNNLYFYTRRCLRLPHEADFALLKLIPASAPGCYVDIGANFGQSIESILLYKPRAEIVSFEPTPWLAQRLARRYQLKNNVRIVPQALADQSGHLTLFVPSYKGLVCEDLASLDRNAAAEWIDEQRVYGFDRSKLEVSEISCEVSTLDAHSLDPIFVKIDVQGCEYRVLKGARETLRRCEPVLLVEDFGSHPRSADLTRELGYEEYYFSGGKLRRGRVPGDNSFLLTTHRMRDLQPTRL